MNYLDAFTRKYGPLTGWEWVIIGVVGFAIYHHFKPPAAPATNAPLAPVNTTTNGTLKKLGNKSTTERIYVTKSGDTLRSIAVKEYGIGDDWTVIYGSNAELVPHSATQKLAANLTLAIPPV